MRRIQQAGNNPLMLVGGATGLIGDPRMSGERVLNSPDIVAGWVEADPDPGRAVRRLRRLLRRADGQQPRLDRADRRAIGFLRDVGKHFRMGRMLAKETVSARLNSDEGLSFTEFSYQILQGMDYLELYRRYGCTLQTGGSDQWGNLTSGTELIRKVEGRAVHAVATPLITKADGTKFGKSEGGAVWLDPADDESLCLLPVLVQHRRSGHRRATSRCSRCARSTRSPHLRAQRRERPQAREGQRALAGELTALVHGEAARDGVVRPVVPCSAGANSPVSTRASCTRRCRKPAWLNCPQV